MLFRLFSRKKKIAAAATPSIPQPDSTDTPALEKAVTVVPDTQSPVTTSLTTAVPTDGVEGADTPDAVAVVVPDVPADSEPAPTTAITKPAVRKTAATKPRTRATAPSTPASKPAAKPTTRPATTSTPKVTTYDVAVAAADTPGGASTTVAALRQQAKERGLTGYSRLTKPQLLALLSTHADG